jgi:hypothetical protein
MGPKAGCSSRTQHKAALVPLRLSFGTEGVAEPRGDRDAWGRRLSASPASLNPDPFPSFQQLAFVCVSWRRFCGTCEAASLLAERLRGKVGSYQSGSELTISTASALSDNHSSHAQFFQSRSHSRDKVLYNVVDSDRVSALKRSKNNVVNCHAGPPYRNSLNVATAGRSI